MTEEPKAIGVHLNHIEINEENCVEGFTVEETKQFLLNKYVGMLETWKHLVMSGEDNAEIVLAMMHYDHDPEIHEKLKEMTRQGLDGKTEIFDEINGQSQAAHNNDNVVDFPTPKSKTVH